MIRWLDPSPVQVPAAFESLNLHPLAAQTLVRRGITDLAHARLFIHPDQVPHTPFPGIEQAVDLLKGAIQNSLEICVWGDFDVDGQTSTALLVQALRALGARVTYYIPVRARESHGVHTPSLKALIERGTRLLLTCDTGITAHEAIDFARAQGLQVVVTDHHDPGDSLPAANAIINPKLLPEGHPLSHLAGVGVAYKLAESLLSDQKASELASLLDLVALGLIADVALLKGETRLLAQLGIQALRSSDRVGLKVMAELARTDLRTLTEEGIGFVFAPRLNALGRLGDANPAVELLLSQDPVRIRVLAAQIEALNAQRRLLTSQVFQAAESQLRQDPSLLGEPALVLSHPNWPAGVVGIVASKLVERYNKPAILLCQSEDGMLRGSARSVEGFHITQAISSQAHLLKSFGGHPMAAGLSLSSEDLAAFRRGLNREVEKQLGQLAQEPPSLQLDAWLRLEQVTPELARALECLAPFGAGNPGLTFASSRIRIQGVSAVDRNREHLRLTVVDEQGNTRQVMWWGASEEELPEAGSLLDIAYSLRLSNYRGQTQLAIQLVNFRLVEEPKPVAARPKIELIDLRSARDPQLELNEICKACQDVQVWAESMQKPPGSRRDQLQPAAELVIYTSPPSAFELRRALEKVSPQKVFVFSMTGAAEGIDEFLSQLAGLCKFAINHKGGRAGIEELAAATGQRVSTVRHGLEWLRAGGHILFEGDEQLVLSRAAGTPDPDLQKSFYLTTRDLLQETNAYRKYFAQTPDPLNLAETDQSIS